MLDSGYEMIYFLWNFSPSFVTLCTLATLKWVLSYTFQRDYNKGTDQTAWMHRLVCAFVICMQQNQVFMGQGPFDYCKFGNFRKGFIFAKLSIFFLKIMPSQNGEIILSFTDICKSCLVVNF